MTGTSATELKDAVLRTIKVYNMYRSPEAIAKLVGFKKDGVIIDFEGAFCASCGVRDYFDDFIYELQTINKTFNLEVAETEPTGAQSFRVHYRIKNKFSVSEDDDMLFREFLLESGLSFKEYLASNSCTKDVIMFHFRTWLFERKQAVKK